MATVQQIYHTHCTCRTSALEQRDSDDVCGYSVRAASLSGAELGKLVDEVIDPLLARKFELPSDAPREQMAMRNAGNTQARMFYYPRRGRSSVLGLVSYRTFDVVERPGSYFAHFLVWPSDASGSDWDACCSLRLWDARGWQKEEPSYDDWPPQKGLPPLNLPHGLRQGEAYAVDDDVLLSFLTTEAHGRFVDPGGVIPNMCREAPPEARQELLRLLLRGFLELDRPQESLLLVADPELASLLFYGILRLVPKSVFDDDVSFSTYETDLRSFPATLVATTFENLRTTDLPEDARQRAGFWLNAPRGMEAKPFRSEQDPKYPELILSTLVQHGWDEVNAILKRFNDGRFTNKNAEDIEELATCHERFQQLFDPSSKSMDLNVLKPGPTREYAKLALRDLVLDAAMSEKQLEDFGELHAKSDNAVLLLELLVEAADAGGFPDAAKYVIERAEEGKLAEIVLAENLQAATRSEGLALCVDREGNFNRQVAKHVFDESSDINGKILPQCFLRGKWSTEEIAAIFRCASRGRSKNALMRRLIECCVEQSSLREAVDSIVNKEEEPVCRDLVIYLKEAILELYRGDRIKEIATTLLDEFRTSREASRIPELPRCWRFMESVVGHLEDEHRSQVERWNDFHKRLDCFRRALDTCPADMPGMLAKLKPAAQAIVNSFFYLDLGDFPHDELPEVAARRRYLITHLDAALADGPEMPEPFRNALWQLFACKSKPVKAGIEDLTVGIESRAAPRLRWYHKEKHRDKWYARWLNRDKGYTRWVKRLFKPRPTLCFCAPLNFHDSIDFKVTVSASRNRETSRKLSFMLPKRSTRARHRVKLKQIGIKSVRDILALSSFTVSIEFIFGLCQEKLRWERDIKQEMEGRPPWFVLLKDSRDRRQNELDFLGGIFAPQSNTITEENSFPT